MAKSDGNDSLTLTGTKLEEFRQYQTEMAEKAARGKALREQKEARRAHLASKPTYAEEDNAEMWEACTPYVLVKFWNELHGVLVGIVVQRIAIHFRKGAQKDKWSHDEVHVALHDAVRLQDGEEHNLVAAYIGQIVEIGTEVKVPKSFT